MNNSISKSLLFKQAQDLLEGEENPEYIGGILDLLANAFPIQGVTHSDRVYQIEQELQKPIPTWPEREVRKYLNFPFDYGTNNFNIQPLGAITVNLKDK